MTELTRIVEQALLDCRNGDWLLLAVSPLATTHLVEECWFAEEKAANQVTPDRRGRALQAVFCWVIDKLRPAGEPDWAMRAWRPYLVLEYYYMRGMPLARLAEQLGIGERSVHNVRQRAINCVVQLLQNELKENNERQQRRYYVIKQRIARQSAQQQQLLRYAALFRQPFPPHWLYSIQLKRAEVQENRIQHDIQELLAAHLLCRAGQDHVVLHPEVGELIQWQPFLPEQLQWHWQAARDYEQRHNYLEAAWHQRQARQVQQAAETLLAHQTEIVEQTQAAALYAALEQFQASEVQASTWVKLKLLCGELAESLHDLDRASEHYRQALAADDLRLKARAFWQRGRVLAAKQGDEALMHYQRCLELLAGLPDEDTLLKSVLIQRAWLYIHHTHNYPQATTELKRIQQMLLPAERGLWSDLYHAWGEICIFQTQQPEALHYHQSAWLAANEAQDVKRMFKTAHSLAWDYVANANYATALHYFATSFALARQIGDQGHQALFYRGIGACHFGLNQVDPALQAYTTAYSIADTMKNDHLRAQLCYDLAQVYAAGNELNRMFHYAEEGQTLAYQQRLADLLIKFQQLTATYHPLTTKWHSLNARQQAVLSHLGQHGSITNRAYRTLHHISPKQAERDLRELVAKQLMVLTGKGRAVRYRIATHRAPGNLTPVIEPG